MEYPFRNNPPLTCDFKCHLSKGGDTALYAGTDWGMPIGTPLFAIENGYVSEGYDPLGAKILLLKSPEREWQYVHLNNFVALNREVKGGELICRSGATGEVTGPHLHLGLLLNGVRIDPDLYIKSYSNDMFTEEDHNMLVSFQNWINNYVPNVVTPYINTSRTTVIPFNGGYVLTTLTGVMINVQFSTDGVKWTKPFVGGSTRDNVENLIIGNTLYQYTLGLDNKQRYRSSTNGIDWTKWVIIS